LSLTLNLKYSSPETVLASARTIHPELRKVIDTILEQTKGNKLQKSASKELKEEFQSMKIDTLDYDTLENFIYTYAPLQLITDRTKSNRMRLSRKIISSCSYLQNASNLLTRISNIDGPNEKRIAELAASLAIEKRFLQPHPLWTSRHDAVLILAIAKHGWIEHDSSCRLITSDPEITWGPPFDSRGLQKFETSNLPSVNTTQIRSTALRAATLLNEHPDFVREVKEFNHHLIIRAYGLVKDFSVSTNWYADPNALQLPSNSNAQSHETSLETMELPTKKDLVRRAKVVLSRASVFSDARKTHTGSPSSFNIALIDQSNICNLLLVELIRCLLKENCGSKSNNKICLFAISEAKKRVEDISSDLQSSGSLGKDTTKLLSDHQDIVQQLELVRRHLNKSVRQYRNVLRVILAEEPQKGKHPDETLFPKQLDAQASDWKGFYKPTADQAVDKARKRILDRFGSKEGISAYRRGSTGLDLTEIETLILSAVCTHGLPVQSMANLPLDVISQESKHWSSLGLYVNKIAGTQARRANEKLAKLASEFDSFKGMNQNAKTSQFKAIILSNMQKAKIMLRSKQEVLRQSSDYLSNPDHFAKKCILLLAKIQESIAAFAPHDSKLEQGLGSKVMEWVKMEICLWARKLELIADNGQPLAFTAIDFVDDIPENDRITIEIYSSFDKHACWSAMGQLALISRLRSICTFYNGSRLREKLDSAANSLVATGHAWEKLPNGWDASSDIVLLQRLAKFGFTNDLLQSRNDFGEQGQVSPPTMIIIFQLFSSRTNSSVVSLPNPHIPRTSFSYRREQFNTEQTTLSVN
jgi:hypothetical protein